MAKQKILYVGNKLSKKGNTPTTIETLGAKLKDEGYELILVSSKQSKLLRLLDMCWSTFKNRKTVSVVLIDTYSTQNFYFAVIVARICRIYNTPYVPILHGGNLNNRLNKSESLSKKLFENAKMNVAPSAFNLTVFKDKGYTNLTYIPNTLDIDKYPFLLRKEIKPKLLWVRSFAEIYNPTLAISIVKQLKLRGLDVSLCMVGPEKDGSLALCKQMATAEDLPIIFPGLLAKEEWLKLSTEYDIFINTTNFDNMPVSVMEAMALGLPVISTNVGGIPFLISDKTDGLLVAPNNAEAFVDAITSLVNNPENAQKLMLNARQKVEAFDWNIVKHSWFTLLDS